MYPCCAAVPSIFLTERHIPIKAHCTALFEQYAGLYRQAYLELHHVKLTIFGHFLAGGLAAVGGFSLTRFLAGGFPAMSAISAGLGSPCKRSTTTALHLHICHPHRTLTTAPTVNPFKSSSSTNLTAMSWTRPSYRIAGKFGGNYIWRNGLQAAKNKYWRNLNLAIGNCA